MTAASIPAECTAGEEVTTSAHLLFAIATSAYILLAIQFEERDLVREFGEPYEDHRGRVPMLVPFTGDRQKAAAEHRATA